MRALRALTLHADALCQDLAPLLDALNADGVARVEGLAQPEELLRLSVRLGPLLVQEDTDARGLKTVTPQAALAGSALHTDRASMEQPPALVWIMCQRQAARGGESILVDGQRLVSRLAHEAPEALRLLQTPQSVCFGVGPLARLGQILSRQGDRWVLRLRLDRWGFYSAPLQDALQTLRSLMDQETQVWRMSAGQSYVVQNGRWLHGALPAQLGPRVIHRVMILPQDPRLAIGWRSASP